MIQKVLLVGLRFLARRYIVRFRPVIIWVTGTVWKTTTAQFLHDFLRHTFWEDSVYKSPYNYNGEFGLPISILRDKSPWNNKIGWVIFFIRNFFRFFFCNAYPKYLVLEYGIDRPGEMDYLTSVACPDIAILTEISPNHVENFHGFEEYMNEKIKILECSKESLVFSWNKKFLKNTNSSITYYGGEESDLYWIVKNVTPISFDCDITYKNEILKDIRVNLSWTHQLINVLPVFFVGGILGNYDRGDFSIISNFSVENGRSQILGWMQNSSIVDGSYNGWFLALSEWIRFMANFNSTHRVILFIGEMRELWDSTKELHEKIGELILNISKNQWFFYKIFLVGDSMNKFVYPMLFGEYKDNIFYFSDSRKAGSHIASILKNQDTSKQSIIYVKGSQNTIFLEEGIKEFLSDNESISRLCRQSDSWMRKKNDFFKTLN